MSLYNSFENYNEDVNEFLLKGYIIKKAENFQGLEKLRSNIASWFAEKANLKMDNDVNCFLNNIHKVTNDSQINDLRMHVYTTLNKQTWTRPTVFSFGKKLIEDLVGNELVMQNKVNVGIMMPSDTGSNISLHSDAHSGESPFQCVFWLPFTNVWGSKGMYILPPEANKYANRHYKKWIEEGGSKKIMDELKREFVWLKIPFGSYIIFSSNLFHGSVPNTTNETRWSINTRFKSLFSPYSSEEKGLGSFYSPIITKPITSFGLTYEAPRGL